MRKDGGRGIKILWDTYNKDCSKLAAYLKSNGRADPVTAWIAQMKRTKPKTINILRFEEEEEVSLVKRHAEEHLEGYKEMELLGQWLTEQDELSSAHSIQSDRLLKYAQLTPETESLLVAAQELIIATKYICTNV